MSTTPATTYELLYFPIRGRGELIRLLMHYTQTPFTDTGVTDWGSRKASMPMGQMPVLIEREGDSERFIPQSMAIVRHIARITGIYGETEHERVQADVVAEGVQDWRARLHLIAIPSYKGTPEQAEHYFSTFLPNQIATFDRILGDQQFVAGGSKPTFADLMLFDIIDANQALRAQVADGYPRLLAFQERIRALPTLAEYLKTRRQSEFKRPS